MAVLTVMKGSVPGQILEVQGERMVLGRHPSAQIVLDNAAVSRHHAQILENHGTYYLEDLRSRNGTFLNGVAVAGRTELHDRDEVRVCDFTFRFLLHPSMSIDKETAEIPPLDSGRGGTGDPQRRFWNLPSESEDGPGDRSSIITTLDASSRKLRLDVKPEAKLRAILEISQTLGKVLRLDEVLPKTLESLYLIFPQADEGFILLQDDEQLTVQATRTRDPERNDSVPISMTIVRQVMKGGEAVLSADAVGDQRFEMSESLMNLQIRSMMCAPLMGKSGAALGVIQINTRDIGHPFSPEDLDLLVSVASQAALAVENATLHEEVLKQRDLERELDFATQVQLGFLPSERPKLPGYDFFDFYEAAHRIGGDYFDYVPLPNNRLAITIGDVAGKGVPAALLMARLYSSVRYQLLSQPGAAKALQALNVEIATSGLGHRFITLLLAIVDPQAGVLTIANAGHLPPLLRTAAGKVRSIGEQESGMPLGIDASQVFEEIQVPIEAGEAVVLYTDGITEAMNNKGDIFGRRRLARLISRGPAEMQNLVREIVREAEKFAHGHPQRDDICIVTMRRQATGAE